MPVGLESVGGEAVGNERGTFGQAHLKRGLCAKHSAKGSHSFVDRKRDMIAYQLLFYSKSSLNLLKRAL